MEYKFNSERVIRFLFGVVGLLVAIDVVAKLIRFPLGLADTYGYWGLLDVDAENSFANFYSSVALLLASILLFLVAHKKELNLGLSKYWYGLAVIFLLFAFDEAIDIHEVVSEHVRRGFSVQGPQGESWLVPYLALTAVFGLLYLWFLYRIPSSVRNGLILAGVVYLIGVAGFEVFNEWYEKTYGHGLTHALLTTIEDAFEMVGVVLLIRTLLRHIEHYLGVLTLKTVKE